MTYNNYSWHGPPAAMNAILKVLRASPIASQLSIIGPFVVLGVAYIKIRTEHTLTLPSGGNLTPSAVADTMMGTWFGD